MKILVIGKGTMGNLIFISLKERYKNDKKTIIDNVSLDKDRIIKKDYDYIIDFSHPDSIKHYKYFLNQKTKIIIGTTNFNEEQEEYLLFLSKMNPIVKDVNFSKGLLMLKKFLNLNKELIKEYHIELIETHHESKIDKPSGTAKSICKLINVDELVSIRNEDLNSSHLVKLSNEFEKIEINHVVYDKEIFMIGILESIAFLNKQKNGLFSYQDVIEWN